jgi:hypothetical protein
MAERKAFLLRIDEKLWEELERWAQDDLRSINGQIEFILRQAIQRRKGRTVNETLDRDAKGKKRSLY